MARIFKTLRFFVLIIATAFVVSVTFIYFQSKDEASKETQLTLQDGNGQFAFPDSVMLESDLEVKGQSIFKGPVKLLNDEVRAESILGKVLSVDGEGQLVLVADETGGDTIQQVVYTSSLPVHQGGRFVYSDGTSWLINTALYFSDNKLAIGGTEPSARLHVKTEHSDTIGLKVQGEDSQSVDLQQWLNSAGNTIAKITNDGRLVLDNNSGHQIELRPSGDTGYLSSSGGSLYINNTNNVGTGIGIYSDAGTEALGNMINVKVDNPLYNQAAFYMNYDGLSNAVEIVSNSTDTSSNALSVTGYNPNDSTVGFIGYETGRGTVKVSHFGSGSDANASGISIDLQGTGTRAQGLYIDSTATGGTTGNLLRLRNQSLDRFVVSSTGSLALGRNGTDTSITKHGNTVGDEFFVGTNGAFRIQRSATNSEAFRTQVVGDSQGRWLGTSDGKLKFGDGSTAQDITMERIAVGVMQLDESLSVTTNLGVGATSFDSVGDNLLTLSNGTAPGGSVADGVQLWAEDVASSSELRVRDEAGNVNTLSPHNFSLIPEGASEQMAWSFYSQRNDIAINADITKALRIVEDLSGEQLVYIKNLATGQSVMERNSSSVKTVFHEITDEQLAKVVSDSYNTFVSKAELAEHVNLADSMWTFLSSVVAKARVIFEDSVEFLADTTFKGNISVNASTAGSVFIPPNTKKLEVTFENEHSVTPLVYVSTTDSSVEYRVYNITKKGFSLEVIEPKSYQLEFSWLALQQSQGGSSNVYIMEESQSSIVEPGVEETTELDLPLEASLSAEATNSATLE